MLKIKKSRILVCVLTLAVFFSLVTTLAYAATELTDGGTLASGDYILKDDVTLTSDITIANGTTVTLDLNGHTLKGTGAAAAITVNGTFTLEDTSESGEGKITATMTSSNTSSGAIYVNGGSFTMESGAISDVTNNINKYGAGVYVGNNGTFTMNSGTISSNTTNTSSGGVYIYGTNAVFTMNGGAISDNTGVSGGGVAVGQGTFTMNDGTISGNTGKGGGVYQNGTSSSFTMNGGTISGNTSTGFGGGLYFYPNSATANVTFEMNGGTIENNTGSYGGGIYAYNGTPTMKGGTISGNTSTSGYGGGVCTASSKTNFKMEGGIISENTATSFGGGISVNAGTFTMSGGAVYANKATSYAADVYVATSTTSSTKTVTLIPTTDMSADGIDFSESNWYTDASNSRYSEDNANVYSVTSGTSITTSTSSAVCLIAANYKEVENVLGVSGQGAFIASVPVEAELDNTGTAIYALVSANNISKYYCNDENGNNGIGVYPTYEDNGTVYVFAGWYSNDGSGYSAMAKFPTDDAYAKLVNAAVLTPGVQILQEAVEDDTKTETDLHMISSVDTDQFDSVGFIYSIDGTDGTYDNITTVYEELEGNGTTISPSEFCSGVSKYLFANVGEKIENISTSATITITPYWVTLDGTTVKGGTANFNVTDNIISVLNS